jgi:hypothetical protein
VADIRGHCCRFARADYDDGLIVIVNYKNACVCDGFGVCFCFTTTTTGTTTVLVARDASDIGSSARGSTIPTRACRATGARKLSS